MTRLIVLVFSCCILFMKQFTEHRINIILVADVLHRKVVESRLQMCIRDSACWSWLVVQPLLSQMHLNRRRLVWQIRRRSIASRRAGRSFQCRQRKGSATIANYRAVKRLMNGHCGDGTIRLVKNNRRMLY